MARIDLPANMRSRPNVNLMQAQRLRRWASIKSTLGQRLVLAGDADSNLLQIAQALAQLWPNFF